MWGINISILARPTHGTAMKEKGEVINPIMTEFFWEFFMGIQSLGAFNSTWCMDWTGWCVEKGNSRDCQHLLTYIGLYQCPNDELQADNLHPFSEKRKWKWINHQSVPPQKQPHRKTMKEKRRPLNCRLLAFSRAFIGVHMCRNRRITHRWRSIMYVKAQVILKLLHLPVYKNSIWTSQLSLKLYFLLWSVRQYIGCGLARLYFPSLWFFCKAFWWQIL